MYDLPAKTELPESLHAARDAVATARDLWSKSLAARTEATVLAERAEGDHLEALRVAAREDRDPSTVSDEQDSRRAARVAADQAATTTRAEVERRWQQWLDTIREQRGDLVEALDPAVQEAESEAGSALQDFEDAHTRLLHAAGLRAWISEVCQPRPDGSAFKSRNGPKPLSNDTLTVSGQGLAVRRARPSEALEVLRLSTATLERIRHDEDVAEAKARQRTGQLSDTDYTLLSLSRL